jgi:uncharacterized repeat protein (TIGR01451 family)
LGELLVSWTGKLRARLSRVAVGAALVGIFGALFAAPAAAADFTAVLQISKTVQDATLAPGEILSYTIQVDCLTDDCVGAQLTDVIPPEFDALTLNPSVIVTGGTSTTTWSGPNNRTLTIDFTKPTPSGPGIPSGDGYSVQVSLTVPTGLSPDWPSNGLPVTNTASVVATTAAAVTAAVPVTVTVPYTIATTCTATWAPSTTQFKVGEVSTLTLATRNTSNAKADTLTLLAPTDPLAAGNLFESVDFASFGTVVFPAGSDRVRVDAFVGGAWVDGAFAATAALPGGVTANQVTGLRITFGSSLSGAQLTANGSAGSIVLNLAQRAATRTAGTSLVTGAVVGASVRGSVSVPGQAGASANASASYTIGGLTSVVSGTTVFSTTRIPGGGSTISTITGRNASNGILAELTVAQPVGGFLTDKIKFGGFTAAGAAWPLGATGADVVWSIDDGGVVSTQSVHLAAGAAFPATPVLTATQRIAGFAITFTGAIPVGATAAVPFRVNVAQDAVPAVPGTGTFVQTARIDGSNDAGAATPVTPTATLTVLYPQVDIALVKNVTPGAAVPAGGRSIVQLRTTTSSDSGYVAPSTIIISDVLTADPNDYWNAFDAVAVAPTQVPVGATLKIETTTDGTSWTQLDQVTATTTALLYQRALTDPNIVGIRFTFTDPAGFAQGLSMQANLAFVARATLRGTSDPSSSAGANVSYVNHASAEATGDVVLDGGNVVSDTATSAGSAVIKTIPGGPGAGLIFAKAWVPVSGTTTVSSQSGQTRTARLSWGVEVSGYPQAQITDSADPTAPVAGTVFQAFDLSRIEAITNANDALIKYDKVTNVELYLNGVWTSVFANACPTASSCLGTFPGYTLTATQRAGTTGVRITFAEYTAARTGNDPLAPPVGAGIASGPDTRVLDLTFQIRNSLRDTTGTTADPWVTGDRVYNDTDNGSVSNSAILALGANSKSSAASILILDPLPGVSLTKAYQGKSTGGTNISSPISIPVPGDVAVGSYPTMQFTMVATNTSAARAWYLRVTDQMPCTTLAIGNCANLTTSGVNGWTVNPYAGKTWDPTTSPFQYLTIRDVNYTLSANSGIDATVSTVTVWYADGTNAVFPLATVAGWAVDSPLFANVVGVSALFGGTSNVNGGTIASGATATLTLETRLRKFLRTDGTVLVGAGTVTNSAFAQAWDGVLVDTAAYTSRTVSFALVDASLAIAVTKTPATTTITEANRTADNTVTITANQSTSTGSPSEVVVTDTSAAFWNAFELRSLTSVSMPTGANRARVDVQVNGTTDWILGTAASSAPALPSGITLNQVTGLRVTYFKADGSLFSVTSPAATWTTSILFVVRLRANYRDSGTPITFPSTLTVLTTNTATGTSTHPTLGTKTASASSTFRLDPGTFKVDVEKYTPVKTTPAGETVNFSLIFENTGTGFLNNPVVVDQLPVNAALAAGGPLLFDPTSEITYSTSAGGVLPTTGVGYVYNSTTRTLTFSWPNGSRLAPGETYTIVIPLQVAPGLPGTYGDVVNTMTFGSDRTLAASGGCTNTSGNGEGVSKPTATTCRTSNDVQTISASAISSFKGVKGDVDNAGLSTTGAINVNNAATACVADSEGFYRNPCAANSRIGATDLWKVQFTNGGNVNATDATIVDVLPKAGDVYLGTGASRGSTFRPSFAGGLTLATDTVGGTTYTWDVTTTANPCPNFMTNSLCTGATWVNGATFPASNYGSITAIRLNIDFPVGGMPPAATIGFTYKTVNTPTTSPSDGRAPVTAPIGTPRAWNSFGVFAQFGSGFVDRRVEPVRAGVQLAGAPLQVVKNIDGVAAAYAPTSLSATASCTVAGAPVVLPASGVLTLAATNATPYTARIDGIPLGASCDIVETTTGASATSYSPAGGAGARLALTTPAGSGSPVPSAQIATITNTYGLTSLTVAKVVSTTATLGSFGPFAFTVACSVNTGSATVPVPLAPGDASFSLAAGDSHLITGLPVTAYCDVREADSDAANSIAMRVGSGSATTVAQNAPYRVTLGTAAGYTVTATNSYTSGQLGVRKEVVGSGDTAYGSDHYDFDVSCTYQGDVIYSDSVTITQPGVTTVLDPVFPVGTICTVTETDAGGATTAATPVSVTIATGTTTALLTNRFDTGSLRIDKSFTGAFAAYGTGPFEAQVVCTWSKPGHTDLVIPLPDSGVVTLTSANGYTATVTGLIGGADCTVTETKDGLATSQTVSAPSPRYVPTNGTSVVSIVNDFAVGSLRIDKVRAFANHDAEAFGDGPFEVAVSCGIDRDGTWFDLDLGTDATQTLSAANGYTVTIDDLIQGAACFVDETDAGLSITHESSTDTGAVVIPTTGSAVVTVTNHFDTGVLDVEKTVDEALVQGGDTLHYSISVANVGTVSAGGVQVTDAIDADLNVLSITAPGWSCSVTGRDVDDFGGTLTCDLPGALGVGGTAPLIAYTALLRDEVAQDAIENTAVVTTTTVVVTGDEDTIETPVEWLAVNATTQCLLDAPWLDYTVDAHNLDVSGRTMHVIWKDAAGTIVHTDDIPIDVNGSVTGRLLFPGAVVDAAGHGVGWPGWRTALPGESPDWENLVLDPTLPSYGLRAGASVEFVINPSTTVAINYPPATASCAETPDDQDPDLWISKVASVTTLAVGDEFDYTMQVGNDGPGAVTDVVLVDEVPDVLRIISVKPADAVGPTDPAWIDCVITDRLPNGYGGTITCELDRELGYAQQTPDVVLHVQLSPTAPAGPILNTATVTAVDLPIPAARGLGQLVTFALQDSALVTTGGRLANTGSSPLIGIQLALALLSLGGMLMLMRRRRPRHG